MGPETVFLFSVSAAPLKRVPAFHGFAAGSRLTPLCRRSPVVFGRTSPSALMFTL